MLKRFKKNLQKFQSKNVTQSASSSFHNNGLTTIEKKEDNHDESDESDLTSNEDTRRKKDEIFSEYVLKMYNIFIDYIFT